MLVDHSMVLAGYFLGGVIENALGIKLEDHIEKVVIVVVFLRFCRRSSNSSKHKFGKANGSNRRSDSVEDENC